MNRSTLRAALTSLLAMVCLGSVGFAKSPSRRGLVDKKPASGRLVKTKHGYMVPYKMRMPGGEGVFEMTPIPGGEFLLGSPKNENGRGADEGPQVRVKIEPFWMAKHEVTWIEYKQFMSLYEHFKVFESKQIRQVTDANRIDAITTPTELYDSSFTFENGEEDRQPAVTMTQYAAKQYTKWLTAICGDQYRLPTEAEWEYACRAETKTAFYFGDDASKMGYHEWFEGNSGGVTQIVGQKKPNPWDLYDMHGNVSEWVIDEYDSKGFAWLAGKSGLTAAQAIRWPTKAYPRVVKGGAYSEDALLCRSAARLGSDDEMWKEEDPNIPLSPWWFTSERARGVGFRLLRPLNEAPREEVARFWEIDDDAIRDDVDARVEEGRGALGIADPKLLEAIKKIQQ
jgi:formylglycine-generating enzyme